MIQTTKTTKEQNQSKNITKSIIYGIAPKLVLQKLTISLRAQEKLYKLNTLIVNYANIPKKLIHIVKTILYVPYSCEWKLNLKFCFRLHCTHAYNNSYISLGSRIQFNYTQIKEPNHYHHLLSSLATIWVEKKISFTI